MQSLCQYYIRLAYELENLSLIKSPLFFYYFLNEKKFQDYANTKSSECCFEFIFMTGFSSRLGRTIKLILTTYTEISFTLSLSTVGPKSIRILRGIV